MRFWHLGIIVKDIDAAMEYYKGLPEGECELSEVSEMQFDEKTCIVGKPCHIKVAFATVRGIAHELIQPIEEGSEGSMQLVALQERGEVIHHVAYIVGETLQETVDGLVAAGGKIIWENYDGVLHVVFVQAKDGAMIYELSDKDPAEL